MAPNCSSFSFEITARCNNNCRHCYINLPQDDKAAQSKELSFSKIRDIVDQAVSLGALWCRITGGEPLLRRDFCDIYLYMKKKGLLVSVYTNATLVTDKHIELFHKYPPRDIEVSVYGVTAETYEKISRNPGSFLVFKRGVEKLLRAGLKVRLKTMALRSNVHELPEIARFCRKATKEPFRFDPFLHLRFDGNEQRNLEIKAERFTPREIVAIEMSDPKRYKALTKSCDKLIISENFNGKHNRLFVCGIGNGNCAVSYNGIFRPCISLWHPKCIYDLKKNNLRNAFSVFIPKVIDMRSRQKEYLRTCCKCRIINLCMECPAYAYLETGELDKPNQYFCDVAHAREQLLINSEYTKKN